MSALATALEAQRRLIAARQSETITELRRHDPGCCMCGDGPTDGVELRAFDPAPGWTQPTMICRADWIGRGEERDFTDLPLVWAAMNEDSR